MKYIQLLLFLFIVSITKAQPGYNEVVLEIINNTDSTDYKRISLYKEGPVSMVEMRTEPFSFEMAMEAAFSDSVIYPPVYSCNVDTCEFNRITELLTRLSPKDLLIERELTIEQNTAGKYTFVLSVRPVSERVVIVFNSFFMNPQVVPLPIHYEVCKELLNLVGIDHANYYK